MSLNRAALRLAMVMLLSNNYKEPFPTHAKGRVFDSRNEPPSQIKAGELVPEITIYTDTDKGTPDRNGMFSFPTRRLDLVIECYAPIWGMGEVSTGDLDDDGKPIMAPSAVMGMADTDSELEAVLDAMEHQVRFALLDDTNPWRSFVLGLVKGVGSWDSGRWADASGARSTFAYRVIRIEVELIDDCPPKTTIVDGKPHIIYELPPIIEKLLAAVEADLDENGQLRGYVAPLVEVLRKAGTPIGTTARPFEKVDVTATLADGAPDVKTRDDLEQ